MTPEQRLAKNAASRAYYAANKEAHKATEKARKAIWYATNKKAEVARKLAWVEINREKHRAYNTSYHAARRKIDPLFKLGNNLRHLVYVQFKAKRWGKTTKTQALLGCTFEEFAAHLQSKFKEGMTLENHGDWHIDHIKPCATATSAEELAALFHFTNLQPLWATENLSKGCKYYD